MARVICNVFALFSRLTQSRLAKSIISLIQLTSALRVRDRTRLDLHAVACSQTNLQPACDFSLYRRLDRPRSCVNRSGDSANRVSCVLTICRYSLLRSSFQLSGLEPEPRVYIDVVLLIGRHVHELFQSLAFLVWKWPRIYVTMVVGAAQLSDSSDALNRVDTRTVSRVSATHRH